MTYRYRQVIEEGGGLTYLRKRFRLTPSELLVLTNLIKHDHPRPPPAWLFPQAGDDRAPNRSAQDAGVAGGKRP